LSVDLHTHTTHSDGTSAPTELIALADQKKLSAIAITDHDITSANREALDIGQQFGIKVVPGVELSVDFPLPNKGHLHLLGLFIDPTNSPLNKTLRALRQGRDIRNQKILDKLKELGKEVSPDELINEAGYGSVGRPHIAAMLLKNGYVKTIRQAFDLYLKKGAPAYFDRRRLRVDESIRMIHHAGGIAILAHPWSLGFSSLAETCASILKLKEMGLDGIEAYWSNQGEIRTEELLKFARNEQLLVSGGSDFHGDVKPEIHLGTGRGDLDVPDQVYWDLMDYWDRKK